MELKEKSLYRIGGLCSLETVRLYLLYASLPEEIADRYVLSKAFVVRKGIEIEAEEGLEQIGEWPARTVVMKIVVPKGKVKKIRYRSLSGYSKFTWMAERGTMGYIEGVLSANALTKFLLKAKPNMKLLKLEYLGTVDYERGGGIKPETHG